MIETLKRFLGLSRTERLPGEAEKWRRLAIECHEMAEKAERLNRALMAELQSERAWKEYYRALAEKRRV